MTSGRHDRPGTPRHRLPVALAPALACLLAASCSSAPAARSSALPAVSPPAPSASGSPSPPGAPADPGFTIAATGDVLVHDAVARRARADGGGRRYDFRRMLAGVRPLVAAADLGICHVETPLSSDDHGLSGYPVFNAPHEVAGAYAWAGYDGCSTASNHALDRGVRGVRSTLRVLDAAGLRHAGTAGSAAGAGRAALYRVKGVTVAHLAYTFGVNGGAVPRGARWSVDLLKVRRVLADAHRARAAGARFVVLSLHWGTEYRSAPTRLQVAQARTLLASPDVDLVLGDHVHVQQPVRRYHGKVVVFGLGNLLSNQSPRRGLVPQTQDGGVVTVHVARHGGGFVADAVTVTATFCQVGSFTVWPVTRTLAQPSTPASLRTALHASLARTLAVHARDASRVA